MQLKFKTIGPVPPGDVWEITDGYKLACPDDFTF